MNNEKDAGAPRDYAFGMEDGRAVFTETTAPAVPRMMREVVWVDENDNEVAVGADAIFEPLATPAAGAPDEWMMEFQRRLQNYAEAYRWSFSDDPHLQASPQEINATADALNAHVTSLLVAFPPAASEEWLEEYRRLRRGFSRAVWRAAAASKINAEMMFDRKNAAEAALDAHVASRVAPSEREKGLAEALRLRVQAGHNDTCSHALDDELVCSCGHDACVAALSAYDAEVGG